MESKNFSMQNLLQFGAIIVAITASAITNTLTAKSNNDLINQKVDFTNQKLDKLSDQVAKRSDEDDHKYDTIRNDVIRLKDRAGLSYTSIKTHSVTSSVSAQSSSRQSAQIAYNTQPRFTPKPQGKKTTTPTQAPKEDYNCSDFKTFDEAMAMFKKNVKDIYHLDGDSDGIPCESLR